MINLKKIILKNKNQYLIVDPSGVELDSFFDSIAFSLDSGVKIIQLKSTGISAKTLVEVGLKLKQLCAIYDALLIVEERVDVAFSIGASGVMLAHEGLSIHCAKEILGENSIIGMFVSNSQQVKEAIEQEADFLLINLSDTNRMHQESEEFLAFEAICSKIEVPCYNIVNTSHQNFIHANILNK